MAPIYEKGVSSDHFTLILQGKVVVHAGSDDFESELGPWCTIGAKALTADPFVPDFRACPQGAVRLLKIRRGDYKAAMRAAQVEAMSGARNVASSRHVAADAAMRHAAVTTAASRCATSTASSFAVPTNACGALCAS